MKINYIFILFLILFSCGLNTNEKKLQGNWYACLKGGEYFEMYIDKDKYRYVTSFGLIFDWNEYRMKDETMIQIESASCDSIIVNESQINFINKNQFEFIDTIGSKIQWTFYRIEDEVIYYDNDSIMINEAKKRSTKVNCPDLRTDEEKLQDSLLLNIDYY